MRVERFKVGAVDKDTRLRFAAPALQAGKVFFPCGQAKELQDQLKNFKFMKHDDLVDSFSMLVITVMKLQSAYHPFPDQQVKIQKPKKGEEDEYNDYNYNDFLSMRYSENIRKKKF